MGYRIWTDQQILDSIQKWADEHDGEPPSWNDWLRATDDHPTSYTVHSRCGSWNQALTMLGFTPKKGGAPKGQTLTRPEHLEEAVELRAKGWTQSQIAETLGVSQKSVSRMLKRAQLQGITAPPPPPKPRNAAERRAARIAALQAAVERERKR